MINDPQETQNIYHNPKHGKLVDSLKRWFVKLRKKVGDDGSHYPECEKKLFKNFGITAKMIKRRP